MIKNGTRVTLNGYGVSIFGQRFTDEFIDENRFVQKAMYNYKDKTYYYKVNGIDGWIKEDYLFIVRW